MWERRYGFPRPARDPNGERQYSLDEVSKLRAIRRLMDIGMRPGKIIHQALDELNALADTRSAVRKDEIAPPLERNLIDLLKKHDAAALQQLLAQLRCVLMATNRSGVLGSRTDDFILLADDRQRAVGVAWPATAGSHHSRHRQPTLLNLVVPL